MNRSVYPIVKTESYLELFGIRTVNLLIQRSCIGIVNSDLETQFSPQILAKELISSAFFGFTRLGIDQTPSHEQLDTSELLMQQLNLIDFAETPYGQLSDGQRRQLMIARALVHKPRVLVLDEPCRGLDLRACHQLLNNLRKLCQAGTTLLVITHRIDTINSEMVRILFMRQGRICDDGTPEQLLQDHKLSDLFQTPLRIMEHKGFRQVLPG